MGINETRTCQARRLATNWRRSKPRMIPGGVVAPASGSAEVSVADSGLDQTIDLAVHSKPTWRANVWTS